MNNKELIGNWIENQKEQIKAIRTKDLVDTSEMESILKGAKIISIETDEGDTSRASEIVMKVQQQDGQIRYVNFGSDEGGRTDLDDEELWWSRFYMKVEEEDPPEIERVPLYVLRYMREFAYKEGTVLAASAAEIREMAIKLYMMSEKLEKRKMDFFRGGYEIHEEITRREREE